MYCLKCKSKTETTDMSSYEFKNGRQGWTGKCAKCHRKKTCFRGGVPLTPCSPIRGGDFQTMSEKAPGFPWSKYSGEKHIPGGYNYCGPGTRLDLRLDSNENPKAGEEPINKVDKACYKHDLAYKNESIRNRQKADVDLIHDLNEIEQPTFGERTSRSVIKNAMKSKIAFGGKLILISPSFDHRRILKQTGVEKYLKTN